MSFEAHGAAQAQNSQLKTQNYVYSELKNAVTITAENHREISVKDARSEEHTSELQSRFDLVCRLQLEKKKNFGFTRPLIIEFPYRALCAPVRLQFRFNAYLAACYLGRFGITQ